MSSLVLVTTGGTIAGWAAQAEAQEHYRAGALSGQALLAQLSAVAAPQSEQPPLQPSVVVDELARINSKDADSRLWWQLYQRLQRHLADAAVCGVVITHGTDTLEETAFFLSEVLPQPLPKPVVLVCAMRPASHPQADGPQNLADALQIAREAAHAARGVLVVCGGLVYAASQVQKLHGSHVQPFVQRQALDTALAAGVDAAWGQVVAGQLCWNAQNTEQGQDGFSASFWQKSAPNLPEQLSNLGVPGHSPRVEIVTSHAGASGGLVQALLAQHAQLPLYGLVVAGTGCGTIHQALQLALEEAVQQGIQVVRASQCLGPVTVPPQDAFLCWPDLSPRQARVRLMLQGWCGQ